MTRPVDVDSARLHLAGLLRALGHDEGADAELTGTPDRVAALLAARFCPPATAAQLGRIEVPVEQRGVVYLRAIPFHSLCAHHMVPFFGHVDLAYLPGAAIAGFGAFARLIDGLGRAPQLQERLAAQIADEVSRQLEARAVVVHIRARQMCMELTGSGCGPETGVVAARGEWALDPWPVVAAMR